MNPFAVVAAALAAASALPAAATDAPKSGVTSPLLPTVGRSGGVFDVSTPGAVVARPACAALPADVEPDCAGVALASND
jgi:hypothetical protein